ncbi:hypothetical protein [Metabacillus niabensis]|uniref:ABC transporter permease n=1 Tax=Metabacillus niabensis TaxID=324854 RepID=A0ABT9YW80_9BACI|nr:hypothetical protein [Metabacillus niabensis]MDQ0224251.1 hypothetical protein [Metabacillus niabensis]
MYLTEVKFADVVMNQFKYKVKAYIGIFSSLLIVQVFGLLMSLNGSSSMGTVGNAFSLSLNNYTGNIVIIFTMLWGFISAITITTKAYKNDDFTFISNRLSRNLANIFFLILASLIGGITALLSGYLLKVVMFFFVDEGFVILTNINITEIILGIFVTSLYMILLSSFGYFIGTVVQLSKWFKVLLPILFLSYLFLTANTSEETTLIVEIGEFYLNEDSLFIFFLKIFITSILLFCFSIGLSNRMEVRQ